jgi:transposase
MKTDAAYQEKSKAELLELLLEKDCHITQQSQYIDALTEIVRILKLRQFGRKTEKLPVDQLNLFDEATLPADVALVEQADAEIQIASYTRKKSVGRKPIPDYLPREQCIYDLPENEKVCGCGHALTHIKDEKSEQLEIIPAKVYVIEHVRKKYACRHCEETMKTAPMPPQPIPRSIAAPGLLSHILVSKFQDHLPLHRQEQMLHRIGIDLPRSTLCLWVIRAAALLKPLLQLNQQRILSHAVAYSDETTVQVLKEPKKSIESKKYMWVFAGGPPEQFVFYYHYHHSRRHEVALDFFNSYRGYIHCDGYQAYDAVASQNENVTLVGCWYHARRKFVEITKLVKSKKGVAHEVLRYIALLSKIEETAKPLNAVDRHQYRITHAKPILAELHDYLTTMQPRIPPKSPLGQAVAYTLNQWPKLNNYLLDGRLEISNNRMEPAIKPFAIGRKGWLFADSVIGAEAAAIIFSFVETCKYHGVEAYDWFRYALTNIPLCQSNTELEALMPFNVDKALLKR